MENVLKSSLLFRFLAALWTGLRKTWRQGFFAACGRKLKDAFKTSRCRDLREAFCAAEDPVPASVYGRVMAAFETWLEEKVGPVLRRSLLCRGLKGLSAFYHRITEGSFVFSRLNRLGLHQWALLCLAFYLPLDYIIRDVLGIAVLASLWEEVFLCGAAVFILWRIALKETNCARRQCPLDMYILLFFAVGFMLMCLVQPYPAIAWAGYRAQVTYILWFFLALRLMEDDKDCLLFLGGLAAMGGILSLHGIYQYIIAVPIPSSWTTSTEAGVRTRVFSLTGSPNIFGDLLVMTAPISAAFMYYCSGIKKKLFFFALTGLMCLCLLFTFSRGAWVGMVLAVCVFAVCLDGRILGLIGAAVAMVLIAVPSITSRITFLFTEEYATASAVGGRALRWATGRELLASGNPWLGFGLGRFGGAVAMNNQVLDKTDTFSYFYMDNYYLKTLVEMGYIGIIFFILMMAALLIWGLRCIYRSGKGGLMRAGAFAGREPEALPEDADALIRGEGRARTLAAGILSSLAGVLVHCYFENIFEEPYMMTYFWSMAAALVYLGFYRKEE